MPTRSSPDLRRPSHHGLSDTEELMARWHDHGDRDAREELFERFRPLARKLAARYSNPHEPIEDLVQVAAVGLLGAIDRFDPDRGVRFPAFAIPTILGELKRYFRNTGWSVHVPRGAQELALRVDRAVRQIEARGGRHPERLRARRVPRAPTGGRARRPRRRHRALLGLPRRAAVIRRRRGAARHARRQPGRRGRELRPGRDDQLAVGRARAAAASRAPGADAAARARHEADRDRSASSAARRCRSRGCCAARRRDCTT